MPLSQRDLAAAPNPDDEESELLSDDEDHANRICAGKATLFLKRLDQEGSLELETESVYGSSIALPQIARSCFWTGTFKMLVIRTYMLLFLNYFCQLSLVYVVFVELIAFDPLGGVMHLCSFGRDFEKCPDAANCVGPGGTQYTKYNLVGDFTDWQSRSIFHSTFKKLWPDKAGIVNDNLDPGEWGLESQYCRFICLFLFTLAAVGELIKVKTYFDMIRIVPTEEASWIDKDGEESHDNAEVGEVKFRISGMPLRWKIINFIVIIIPKLTIWFLVFIAGSKLIIKTSDIMNTVLNSLAMLFVLDIDEIIMSRLGSSATLHIMTNLEEFAVMESDDLDKMTHKQAVKHFHKDGFSWHSIFLIVPWRMVFVLLLFIAEILMYYHANCVETEDGSWISKSTFAPLNVRFWLPYGISDALFHALPKESTPIWTMPAVADATLTGTT